MSLSRAQAVLARALDFAAEEGLAVAAVVVDAGGHPVAAARMDGAPFVALDIAREKAWTAAAFGSPTARFRESSAPGGPYWGMTHSIGGRLSVLSGGAPLQAGERTVGAVGISGADDAQDHDCAQHAVAAPAPR